MKVIVSIADIDVIETEDFVLCANILNLIAQSNADESLPTAEEQLLYELRTAKQKADNRLHFAESHVRTLEDQINDLRAQIDRLTTPSSVDEMPTVAT